MVDPIVFKHERDDWETPPELWHLLYDDYGPLSDPCPAKYSRDGLITDWPDRNYVNPPYSRIGDNKKLGMGWAAKAYNEFKAGRFVVFLCPARTDTEYFHKYLLKCQKIRLFEGRLQFMIGDKRGDSAPFPSMLCVFDPALAPYMVAPIIEPITKERLKAYRALLPSEKAPSIQATTDLHFDTGDR